MGTPTKKVNIPEKCLSDHGLFKKI